jgi:hypothetical protein
MYLVCTRCVEEAEEGKLDLAKASFFFAKYYPNTGWYIRGGKTLTRESGESIDFVDAIDAWFDEHKHGGMYGEYIYPVFESAFGDSLTDAKRAVLDAVTKVYSNLGQDKAE